MKARGPVKCQELILLEFVRWLHVHGSIDGVMAATTTTTTTLQDVAEQYILYVLHIKHITISNRDTLVKRQDK